MPARDSRLTTLVVVALVALAGFEGRELARAGVRERLERFAAEQERRAAAEPREHEAIYGSTLPGVARDHYRAAGREVAPLGLRWQNGGPAGTRLLSDAKPLSDATRARIAGSLESAVRSVRSGARCSSAGRGPWPDFLLDAVVADAEEQAVAAGDLRTACELFVDRCVLASDVRAALPCLSDERLAGLDRGCGAFLDAALQRLEARWRPSCSPESVVAYGIRSYSELNMLQFSFSRALGAWEFGFDAAWQELVLCDRLLDNLPAAALPAAGWNERRAQLAAFGRGVADVSGTWASEVPRSVEMWEQIARRGLVELRLLRLALAFVQGLELPALDDPLGHGPLRAEVRGDAATFTSAAISGQRPLERKAVRRG